MLVEIWSDVVCPWCAIGRQRFLTALEGFAHRDEVEDLVLAEAELVGLLVTDEGLDVQDQAAAVRRQ